MEYEASKRQSCEQHDLLVVVVPLGELSRGGLRQAATSGENPDSAQTEVR